MSGLNKQERTGAGLATGSMLLVGGSVTASSVLGSYPVLGGQGVRYLAAGLLLAAWARLRSKPLPRPAGRGWAWLTGLAIIGLAGCSVLLIEATRVADPASVGVVIGAAPLVIVIAAALAAGNRPTRRVLLAVTVYACSLAGIMLLAAAAVVRFAGDHRSCANPPRPNSPRCPTSRSRSPPWCSSPGSGQWNALGWPAPDCSMG